MRSSQPERPASQHRLNIASGLLAVVLVGVRVVAGTSGAAPATATRVFQLNTHTKSDQRWPEVAVSDDGRTIVAGWASLGQHGDGWEVVGQRFDADGNKIGGEFALDDFRNDVWPNAEDPSIDFDGQGNFAVAWHSYGTDAGDGGWTIWERRYRADGTPFGPGKLVPTQTRCDQWRPTVLVAADGDALITWYSDTGKCDGSPGMTSDIRGRMLDARDEFKGGEFGISGTSRLRRLQWRQGACNRAGVYVSYWYAEKPVLAGFARTLDDRGTAISPVLTFSSLVNVGVRGDGSWLANSNGRAQWRTRMGLPAGDTFEVAGDEIAMNDRGYFVTIGVANGAEGHGLYAYPYDAAGKPVGSPIHLSAGHVNITGQPHIDMSESGLIVAAWEEGGGSDGDGAGVWGAVARHPLMTTR